MDENILNKELEIREIKETPYMQIARGIVKVLGAPSQDKKPRLLDMVEIYREVDKIVLAELGDKDYGAKYEGHEREILILDTVRMFDGNVIKRQGIKYRLKGSFRRRLGD